MNGPRFWVQKGLKILLKDFNGRYDRPTITQILTYEVINYYVPAGDHQLLFTKLDFIPKLGDIITFGESHTCYTIIEFPHENRIKPRIIFLDRPLEEPIQANRAGFVTETVYLREWY